MNTPTDTNSPNKRTRIDENAVLPPGTEEASQRTSPLAAADSFIRTHVASLQRPIATILEKLALQHLHLQVKHHNKSRHASRMELDQEFIPRSARVAFDFHVSAAAEKNAEFIILKGECEKTIETYKQALKGYIVSATKIEALIAAEDIKLDFVKSLRLLTKAILIGKGLMPSDPTIDQMVADIMEPHHEVLLVNTHLDWLQFKELYRVTHALATVFPTATPLPATAPVPMDEDDGESLAMQGFIAGTRFTQRAAITAQPRGDPNIGNIKRLVESLIHTARSTYVKQEIENDIAMEVKKLNKEYFTKTSTDEANELLEAELPSSRPQLDQLIQKQAKLESKRLQQSIDTLKRQLLAAKVEKTLQGANQRNRLAPLQRNRPPSTKRKNRTRGSHPQPSPMRTTN